MFTNERRTGSHGRGNAASGKFKRSPRREGPSAKSTRYQLAENIKIDYKNITLLQKYVTDRGKIVSRRLSGVSAKRQRELAQAIKSARFLGLLPVGVKRK